MFSVAGSSKKVNSKGRHNLTQEERTRRYPKDQERTDPGAARGKRELIKYIRDLCQQYSAQYVEHIGLMYFEDCRLNTAVSLPLMKEIVDQCSGSHPCCCESPLGNTASKQSASAAQLQGNLLGPHCLVTSIEWVESSFSVQGLRELCKLLKQLHNIKRGSVCYWWPADLDRKILTRPTDGKKMAQATFIHHAMRGLDLKQYKAVLDIGQKDVKLGQLIGLVMSYWVSFYYFFFFL